MKEADVTNKTILLSCVMWLLVSSASFSYNIDCGQSTSPCDDDPCKRVGANPITPLMGNVSREVTDLETFGTAPIAFQRIYNSRTVQFSSDYWQFGAWHTWAHNWNYEVLDQTSIIDFTNTAVRVRYPMGTDLYFRAVDSNGVTRVPPAYRGDRLYRWTGATQGHTLVTPTGWEYDFQRSTAPYYQLTQIRNGQGLKWTLSYTNINSISWLRKIQNDFGRFIEIDRETVNWIGRIKSVRSSDGRQVDYTYASWPSVANNVLTNVVYPDGTKAVYTYVNSGSASDSNRPLLATAVDPRYDGTGAQIKYVYNAMIFTNQDNSTFTITGMVKEERNLITDELIVSLPLGSGHYPQILEGDGTEITRKHDNKRIIESRDGEGRLTLYEYDSMTTTNIEYDLYGNIVTNIGPTGYLKAITAVRLKTL